MVTVFFGNFYRFALQNTGATILDGQRGHTARHGLWPLRPSPNYSPLTHVWPISLCRIAVRNRWIRKGDSPSYFRTSEQHERFSTVLEEGASLSPL